MPTTLNADKRRDYARAGVEPAIKKLRAEIIAIERTLPELALTKRRRALRRSVKRATKRTAGWSASARKAASERMKRCWAERGRALAKVK